MEIHAKRSRVVEWLELVTLVLLVQFCNFLELCDVNGIIPQNKENIGRSSL